MNPLSYTVARVPDERADAAAIVDWLSALFAAPLAVDAVAAHRRGPAADLMARLAEDVDLAPGLERMRRALDCDEDDSAVAGRLARAYGLAFEGIGGPVSAPPYESAFREGPSRRLCQAPTAEMEALLAHHGLSVAADIRQPADHLAIELALTARLATAGNPASAAMFRRLSEWVPAFAAECAVIDRDGFWAGAATVLAAVVSRELRVIEAAQSRAAAE